MKTKYHSNLSVADAQNRDRILSSTGAIRGRWLGVALGGFLFTSIFALSAPPVEAQCKQWNVGGEWRFKQGTLPVKMNLRRKGIVITGTASFTGAIKKGEGGLGGSFGETGLIHGTVDGTLEGDSFAVKIEWDNNTTGVYEGTIGPSGKIEGKGWERRSPRTKVRWYSETRMVCADKEAAQPKPTTQSAPTAPVQPPPTPSPAPPPILTTQGEALKKTLPYIRALPQIVSIPRGDNEALTKLVWFAGNDHPNAQVVVAVDGGDERLVDSQRKGSRQVKVKAGEKYVYTLIDAGEPLASVVVQTDQSAPPDRQRLREEPKEPPQDSESDNDENQGDE
jgi:hypothetical protein